MARELFKRYIWLVDTISQAEGIDYETINDKWLRSSLSDGSSYPKKTFQNHKKSIQEIFDINIECDSKDGYKYYIENIDDLKDSGTRDLLLNAFTLSNLLSESRNLKNRIHLENIPSGQKYLTPIIEAMHQDSCIEMTYQSYWRDSAETIQIEPYFVKIFKQRWYVIAYNRQKQAMRIYALDRISKLNGLADKFEFPTDFDPDKYFQDCYGIIHDDEIDVCTVKIRVSTTQAKYLRDLPLHNSQEEEGKDGDRFIFKYFIKPSFDFKKELLSIGVEVEVLQPEWFRNEVMEEINEMNKYYKKKHEY
jgi:hypothetical protein